MSWLRGRKSALVERKLANKFGWQLGDSVPLKSGIHSDEWNFVVRGIHDGVDGTVNENQMLIHGAFPNENMRARQGGAAIRWVRK